MKIKPDILRKFFNGNYSQREFREVESYFKDENLKDELKDQLQNHWEDYSDEKDFGVEFLLSNLQRKIYLEENKQQIRLKPYRVFQRVAAILILPIIFAFSIYIYLNSEQQLTQDYAEIYCPLGTRTRFVLPDGSTGFLNNGSTLKYPVKFSKVRKVTLSGEGFFDVAKNGKSFHVYTKNLDIKVMGTSFNVLAYENEASEEVVLQTGKVNIATKAGKTLTNLLPNEQLILDTEKYTYQKNEVIASQFTSWVNGKLVFRNEEMDQVAKRLSRWYNADVSIADERLNTYTFHATFMDEPLDEVLKLLSLTTPIIYEETKVKSKDKEELHPKRKITLKLKN